tara:strand:- start:1750 stop:2007 length:258 start_codon:yes stop_codon:yes gene_type:complete
LSKITILHSKCDPNLAQDKNLPYTAYLLEYVDGETTCYDIAMSSKKVDLFDHYWDTYNTGFKNMTQTEGRINPKLYGYGKEKKKK